MALLERILIQSATRSIPIPVEVSDVKLSYVCESEQDGAEFWLKRVGWEPSELAKKIAQENDPKKTSYIADIGGAHGREALWLAEQGFLSILIEPNKYSLRFAKERAKNRRLELYLINAALPCLPMRSEVIEVVDFYWTLHQIPDEHKLASLKEIHRILKPHGTLFSTSFGHWESHEMPRSIHPVAKKQTFLNLHVSAGFKPRGRIEKRSDSTISYEKSWCGIFQKPAP
nr:class I SAM-dependent methyltransferase [Candidatus Njordarchaeota archaeon]